MFGKHIIGRLLVYVRVIEDGVKPAMNGLNDSIKILGHTHGVGILCTDDSISKSKVVGCDSMHGEGQLLVTDAPVEFEKKPVEVEDFWKVTHHLRGIYGIYFNSIKKNRKMSTCS